MRGKDKIISSQNYSNYSSFSNFLLQLNKKKKLQFLIFDLI